MARREYVSLLAFLLSSVAASPVVAVEPLIPVSVEVFPKTVELRQYRQPYAIRVMGKSADGYGIDLAAKAKLTVGDPKIASVDDRGWVHPLANGQTQVSVLIDGKTLAVPVNVQISAQEPPMSFRHEVMPVLSKSGCNAGACHGYSLGKNGFKLSLRGADPDPDFHAMTKEISGRRINRIAPDASLLLTKALGEVNHDGGARFSRGSLSHEIMKRWIEQNAPGDLADTSEVVAVRMTPDKLVLRPGDKHRITLTAEYNDGRKRDVTRLGIFTANNDMFAKVDEEGLVTAADAGETVIVGRFERTFAATGVIVLKPEANFKPSPVPTENLIDRFVVEKLNRLKILPSVPATDEEYLRRVFLDLIGLQPKPDEIRAFLADTDPNKRRKIADALFERPEFVDHWSLKWGDLLQNSRNSASSQSVYLFREFIRGAVAQNMPLDEFTRKILTAKGSSQDDPASVYFAVSKDANDTVERVTQVFCGVRMLCARCHAHPMENWTQADYFGISSFFNQVGVKADGRLPNVANSKVVQLNLAAGAATNPRTNKPQLPRFLGGEELQLKSGIDRRDDYAKWLTSPKNPFFARGLVNRVWSYFYHRGIIDPVDDIRSTNPPINPELLEALTNDFIESKFNVRHLMTRIVTSQTYQRSSMANASNKHDEQNFSHTIPRRVPAEAILDSLVQATGVAENFGGAPAGFRAAQLPDGGVENAFLRLFGKPQRMDACECERDNGSNMLQALHFINGPSILGRVQNPSALPAMLMQKKLSDSELVREIYLWSLARNPKEAEVKLSLEFIKSRGDKKAEAIQDLMWALLNSKDFLLTN
ncbi:DUF1549 and DUF1553 domain-containing protein [Zavarzinella formosa]|uniref:DUF1549 and DUF1553 domain-containing protein n=1 Tax=Zavarzinella formosa TaxID=360055 RepID=UPI0002FC3BEA|nr:DUF1549 and DUF1553 domain-containing protein [Zavarzinella formosa]